MNLIQRLSSKDKKGFTKPSKTPLSYPTGLLPFDYSNGYLMKVRNEKNEVIDTYPMVGLPGGRMFTIAGKSGTGKTTLAIGMASKIIKPFKNANIIHLDIEQATSNTRVMSVTDITREDIETLRYMMKNDMNAVEDIYEFIEMICAEKEENRSEYTYNSGRKDEFNQDIIEFVPTVFIIDSIISMVSRDLDKEEFGSTDAMQLNRRIKAFYKKCMPICAKYNIFIININHLLKKINMGFAKEQAQTNYFSIDEYSPGGDGPIIYAHTMLKVIASDKRTKEDDGYDGFLVKCKLLKSRTNRAGRMFVMVYDQVRGFCPFLTMYEYAKSLDLIEGRNPYRHFKGSDIKFDSRKLVEYIGTPEGDAIYNAAIEACGPELYAALSTTTTNIDADEDMVD